MTSIGPEARARALLATSVRLYTHGPSPPHEGRILMGELTLATLRTDMLGKARLMDDDEATPTPTRIREWADLVEQLEKALLDLTPGGSEFVNDPMRCVEFVKDRMANVMKVAKENKQLEADNAALREVGLFKRCVIVHDSDNFVGALDCRTRKRFHGASGRPRREGETMTPSLGPDPNVWTMGDAIDAQRRLLDVADRMNWRVNEEEEDDDWVLLSEAATSVEALEAQLAAALRRVETQWHPMTEEPSGSGWKAVTLEEKSRCGRIVAPIYFYSLVGGVWTGEWDHKEDGFRMVAWADLPPALALQGPGEEKKL